MNEVEFGTLIDSGVLLVSDGYRAKNDELGGDGPIFLRAGKVGDGVLDLEGTERFRTERIPYLRQKLSAPGDVLVVTKGWSTGRVAYVGASVPSLVYSPHTSFWRSLDHKTILPGFLRYWARGRQAQDQLLAFRMSTDVHPYLSLIAQRKLRITIPTPGRQRAIARILGALDDKIELNRRTNETLEAMARALFQSWFVDFDPVRAKMEGRQPEGMDAETAKLFPSKLATSEDGAFPTGWERVPLGDLVSLERGLSYAGRDLADAGVPLVNLGCFSGDGRFLLEKLKHHQGEYRDRHLVAPGEMVIANTDITQKRTIIGSPAIVPSLGPRILFSHHVYAARRHEQISGHWVPFLFYTLLQPEQRERCAGFATGTTVLALPRDAILDLPVCRPPERLVQGFAQTVLPLWSLSTARHEESSQLTALRDTLLPKLLSGELRVPEAEKAVSAVL